MARRDADVLSVEFKSQKYPSCDWNRSRIAEFIKSCFWDKSNLKRSLKKQKKYLSKNKFMSIEIISLMLSELKNRWKQNE